MTKIYGLNENYQLIEMLVDQDPVELFDREHNNTSAVKLVFDENGKAVETKVVAEPETEAPKATRPPYYVAPTAAIKVAEPSWKSIRIVKDAIIFVLEPMRRSAMRRSDYKKVGAIDRLCDLLKRAKKSDDPDQPGYFGSVIIKSDLNEWQSILDDDGIWNLISETDIDLSFRFDHLIFVH